MTIPDPARPVPVLVVPEIRDYERINAELIGCLEEGHARIRLAGAEGQRFLASSLTGPWNAVIEVEGRAGPELASALNAPGLTVICRGPAADGAGRGLKAGRLVILGDAGDALAYAQEGGTILATKAAGHRAGLNQRGGVLAIFGDVGRLAGERQAGGRLLAYGDRLGPHAGLGHRGGRFVRLASGTDPLSGLESDDADCYRQVMRELGPWVAPS